MRSFRRFGSLDHCRRCACRVGLVLAFLALGTNGVRAGDDEHHESEAGTSVDQCVACHTENDNLPADYSPTDVHLKPGLSCAGCHGGDPTQEDQDRAMSRAAGFRGVPSREEIPAFCGRCHSDIDFMRQYQPRIPTDQASQYASSVHGIKLKQHDHRVATCSNCHTAHGILPASDTRSTVHAMNVPATCGKCHGDPQYMASYGIPTDQLEKFKHSVHGVALLENEDTGAPACNDCHGNHGATPPGVTSIGQVCGHCHVNNMKYFSESRMGHAFVEEGYHGCEECHGNHGVHKASDEMVGTGQGAVCVSCHSEGEAGFETAGKIHARLAALTAAQQAAAARQTEVRRVGMDDVDIEFLLQESHQSLIEARTLVHTFDPDKVGEKTQEGITKAQEATALADRQIKDYRVRRIGLGMATLFTTVLALALFLRIRQLEGR